MIFNIHDILIFFIFGGCFFDALDFNSILEAITMYCIRMAELNVYA